MTETSTGRRSRRALTTIGAAVLLAFTLATVASGDAYARQAPCRKLQSGQVAIALPDGATSDSWHAEFTARFHEQTTTDFAVPVQIQSPRGDVNDWQFLISEGRAHFNWEDSSGSYTDIVSGAADVVDGRWHTFRADVAQVGADIDVVLTVDGVTYGPSIVVGKILDSSGSSVRFNPLAENAADAIKHFMWQSSTTCAKAGVL